MDDEFVELAPGIEGSRETVLNADRVVRDCLVGLSLRKKGITEKDYYSPFTVDDGRQ
ncbi:MAG: hypothetical protein V7711_08285 [Pseudomonadales bacterium]